MAGLILYNALNNNRIGLQERHFKDKIEPLDYYNDRELKERFRFDSEGIRFIMAALPNIRRQTRRNQALSSSQQICIALSYYGSGSFQRVCNIYFFIVFCFCSFRLCSRAAIEMHLLLHSKLGYCCAPIRYINPVTLHIA